MNGADIGAGPEVNVQSTQINSAVLKAGNDIGALAFLTVPAGADTYIDYWIATVDPRVMSPVAGKGAPTPADIVATARRFDTVFGHPLNDNDCQHIAAEVAAATGASLPILAGAEGLNPAANKEAGFWRIVYRGSDPNPVANWQTLVKPGDVVRMGWSPSGEHTTTILEVNADGSIVVYDNCLADGSRGTAIGIHQANYDTQTIPTKTTIYRLSPDRLYLENGSSGADTLPGTIFNDDVRGFGGNDNLSGAVGNDYLAGGLGNDTLNGGVGSDWADYVGASGAVTVSLLTNTSSGAAGNDTLVALENIRGGQFADNLTGNSGNNLLNGGPGGDVMSGGGGSDTFIVDNVLDQVIESSGGGIDLVQSSISYRLGATIERLTLTGTTPINGIGNPLNNAITGNAGANNLQGLAGNDVLNGGAAKDSLWGGPGDDTFLFRTALSPSNLETIMDFSVVDTIKLENAIFKALPVGPLASSAFFVGAQAHDANDRIIYNSATGALLYDPDGTGSQAATQFATMRNAPALSYTDFVVI